jgi:hypothetical protein
MRGGASLLRDAGRAVHQLGVLILVVFFVFHAFIVFVELVHRSAAVGVAPGKVVVPEERAGEVGGEAGRGGERRERPPR